MWETLKKLNEHELSGLFYYLIILNVINHIPISQKVIVKDVYEF